MKNERPQQALGFAHDVRLAMRFEQERRAGINSGNHHLTTAAGCRLAVLTFNSDAVAAYLIESMGISATVVNDQNDALLIGVRDHHAITAIMHALRGAFPMVTATTTDGRQALKVLRPPANEASTLVIDEHSGQEAQHGAVVEIV